MIFKILFCYLYSNPFIFNIIITCEMSWVFTGRFFNYINVVVVKNFNLLSSICYSFIIVKYHDILVIKMTFVCKKSFYNIPKIFVCHNFIFSNTIKVFSYAFSPQRYAFIPLCFMKSLLLMGFFRTYYVIQILYKLLFLALYSQREHGCP